MKTEQFLKGLVAEGVKVTHCKRHYKLTKDGKWTTLSRHPSKEVSNAVILKVRRFFNLR